MPEILALPRRRVQILRCYQHLTTPPGGPSRPGSPPDNLVRSPPQAVLLTLQRRQVAFVRRDSRLTRLPNGNPGPPCPPLMMDVRGSHLGTVTLQGCFVPSLVRKHRSAKPTIELSDGDDRFTNATGLHPSSRSPLGLVDPRNQPWQAERAHLTQAPRRSRGLIRRGPPTPLAASAGLRAPASPHPSAYPPPRAPRAGPRSSARSPGRAPSQPPSS